MKRTFLLALLATLSLSSLASADGKLTGMIRADGSSTVFPISEALAEEFQKANPGVRVTVGVSGTGGGFKKFTAGESDISNASRPITAPEREAAKKNGIDFVELPIAYDGIVVVVNPKNMFATSMTVAELKRIWEPGSTVKMWSDIRADWPKKKINLYGPGADSGTFDYFTEAIVGKAKSSRADFMASEDDNVLVKGIEGDENALGYFGYSYYVGEQGRLKAVAIGEGKAAILPTEATIHGLTYTPLARPLFVYVTTKAAKRPEVAAYFDFMFNNVAKLVKEVGYVPLSPPVYTAAKIRFENRMIGTVFGLPKSEQKAAKMEDLVKLKGK